MCAVCCVLCVQFDHLKKYDTTEIWTLAGKTRSNLTSLPTQGPKRASTRGAKMLAKGRKWADLRSSCSCIFCLLAYSLDKECFPVGASRSGAKGRWITTDCEDLACHIALIFIKILFWEYAPILYWYNTLFGIPPISSDWRLQSPINMEASIWMGIWRFQNWRLQFEGGIFEDLKNARFEDFFYSAWWWWWWWLLLQS